MADPSTTDWLTVPELVEILGIPQGRVRRLLEDRALLGSRADGVLKVPAEFVVDGEPMPELRGTITVLIDAGFSEDEALRWLLDVEPSIDARPVDALRAGRKAEVRRVAQSLAF